MRCIVVGGGISGLATAFYLRQLPKVKSILLLEASDRLGGWIQTTRHADGVRHEHGPRTIRPVGPRGANTLHLAEALGLGDKIVPISKTHPSALNRFVLVDGELHKLPSDFKSLFRRNKPFTHPLAWAAWTDLTTPAKMCEDDSLFDFVSRRFGKDVAQYAIDPMTRGICAGNARDISAASFVAGPLFRMEQEYGGVTRAVIWQSLKKLFGRGEKKADQESSSELVKRSAGWSVWSLENGLETLVSTLADNLKSGEGISVVTNATVTDVKFCGDRPEVVVTDGTGEYHADHVFLTSPAFATARLLNSSLPGLASLLRTIPFVTVAVVTVEFDRKVTYRQAFGFLVPSNQPQPILGAIFDTCAFPQGDKDIFTVMMGGHWFKELFGECPDEEVLKNCAVGELKKILGIGSDPSRVTLKVQRDCIAQYVVGHQGRVTRSRSEISAAKLPISLVGSSYDGVGINDSIMSARDAVMQHES